MNNETLTNINHHPPIIIYLIFYNLLSNSWKGRKMKKVQLLTTFGIILVLVGILFDQQNLINKIDQLEKENQKCQTLKHNQP